MQTRLVKTLPFHPTLTLHGRPVQALGVNRRGGLIWPVHGGAPEGDDKTFTQEQLDAATAQARDRGRREALKDPTLTETARAEAHREFLKAAGLPEDTKPEDVGTALKKARDKELEQLGEVERAKREAEDAKAELQRERDAAAEREKERERRDFDQRVNALIAETGVGAKHDKDPEKKAAEVARIRKLLTVKDGADSDDIRKAIDEVKTEYPALFPDPDETGGAGGEGGLPDGRPGTLPGTQRTGKKSGVAKGRDEALGRGWKKPPVQQAS